MGAKLRVLWSEVLTHEAIIEITDETYTGSAEQEREILSKLARRPGEGTHARTIDDVDTLRPGSTAPVDQAQAAYTDDRAEDIAFERSHGWDGPEREGRV